MRTFCLLFLVLCSCLSAQKTGPADLDAASVTLSADRTQYDLGEPISLNVNIENHTSKPIETIGYSEYKVRVTYYMAYEGKPFEEIYYGGGGAIDSRQQRLRLGAGEVWQDQATLLREQGSPNSPGCPNCRAYLFDKAGYYHIKAVISEINTPLNRENEPPHRVESNPIAIRILEPEGSDRVIWQQIRNDSEVAVFLESGEWPIGWPGYLGEPSVKTAKLEKLLERNPGSRFERRIRPVLIRWKETHAEAK